MTWNPKAITLPACVPPDYQRGRCTLCETEMSAELVAALTSFVDLRRWIDSGVNRSGLRLYAREKTPELPFGVSAFANVFSGSTLWSAYAGSVQKVAAGAAQGHRRAKKTRIQEQKGHRRVHGTVLQKPQTRRLQRQAARVKRAPSHRSLKSKKPWHFKKTLSRRSRGISRRR